MDSLTSEDDKREERRVQFVGLDWSAEEERAERRRQATIRRKTLKQQQKEQELQAQKQKAQKKMVDAEGCKEFLVKLTTAANLNDILKLEYAGTILAVSTHMGFAPNAASHVDLINGLLTNWVRVVANESILDIIKAWIKKDEEETPLHGLAFEDVEVESDGKPTVESSDSFDYSTDSDGPTMNQDVKNSMTRVLSHSNVLDVVKTRYTIKKNANASDGDMVDACITLVRVVLRTEGIRLESPQALQQDLNVVRDWLAKPMTGTEQLFLLFAIFDDFVARYEVPNEMARTVVALSAEEMANPQMEPQI